MVMIQGLVENTPSFKEACSYMFKDNKFLQKFGIYYVLSLIAMICTSVIGEVKDPNLLIPAVVLWIVGVLLNFIPFGYFVSAIKALKTQKDNFVLPMFNFGKNFKLGFKYAIASLLFGLAAGFAFAAITLIFAIVFGIFSAVIKNNLAFILFAIIVATIVLIPVAIYCYRFLAMYSIFAQTEAFTSFFKFKQAGELVVQNQTKYNKCFWLIVLLWLLFFIITIVITLLVSILFKGIAAMIIGFVIIYACCAYVGFVNMYLIAKATK